MTKVSVEDIQRAIAQLGEGERRDVEIEIAVARFAGDKMTVRRLVDWIPEVFGVVLLPHVAEVVLPVTFTARAQDGTWKEFPFEREPIVALTLPIAVALYNDGGRAVFSSVVKRSSMVVAVNKALNAGSSLDGVVLAGPAMSGIPAEFYDIKPKAPASFWRKLVG
jgi:hypothetical protein